MKLSIKKEGSKSFVKAEICPMVGYTPYGSRINRLILQSDKFICINMKIA